VDVDAGVGAGPVGHFLRADEELAGVTPLLREAAIPCMEIVDSGNSQSDAKKCLWTSIALLLPPGRPGATGDPDDLLSLAAPYPNITVQPLP
jgi:hypothetical protein